VLFLPPYCVGAGRGLAAARGLGRGGLAGVILLGSALSLGNLYRQPQKEGWREAAQRIVAQAQPGDVICLVDEDISAVVGYYYQGPLPVFKVSGALQEGPELAAVADRLAGEGRRAWLVMSHTTNDALWRHLERDGRFALSERWEFIGIQLALFARVG